MKYLLRILNSAKSWPTFLCPLPALMNKSHVHWKSNFSPAKSQETELVKQLKTRIKLTGPITVADYIKEVLSNPLLGYYMNKDVFGVHGDFITSPEISQMFGEMIGVWFYDQWLQHSSPTKLQLVELGPGRGTLLSDVLRVFRKLGKILQCVNICLVEFSPAMKKLQKKVLSENTDIPASWHNNIFDVPKGLTFYLAHEFFDALPIHQFQKTEHGWHEVMVDINNENGPYHLKFCLAPGPTPATVLIPLQTKSDQVEVRPQAQGIVEEMGNSINKHGGCSLIIDYGDMLNNRHTLRAFQNHKLVNPLLEPGTLDLTSNVDFSHLRNTFEEKGVQVFGPVTQKNFLMAMGINVRKQQLLQKASVSQAKDIETSFAMLTEPEQMGECFKFLTAVSHGTTKPAGF